ncbi:MAG TPA: tetratricopeptide repeat protein [Byssovorax sp.]|jgi:predicted O-linked N-acetylglucosamine transferase (SPINDLY family)
MHIDTEMNNPGGTEASNGSGLRPADDDALEQDVGPDQLASYAASLVRSGREAEADALYRELLGQFAAVHHGLAMLEASRGRWPEALILLRVVAYLRPGDAAVAAELSRALLSVGDVDEAVVVATRAVELNPNHPNAHEAVAMACIATNRPIQAQAAFEIALSIEPGSPGLWRNLAVVLLARGLLTQALDAVLRVRALDPSHIGAAECHVSTLHELGRFAEARRVIADLPPQAHPSLILSFADSETPVDVVAARYVESVSRYRRASPRVYPNRRDPDRRLRVGYVSGDFREHSVASFIGPPLAEHDADQVEVFCYYNGTVVDRTTVALGRRVDHFERVRQMSDDELDARIRADKIDLLVDLGGCTADHRLGVFGRAPAPILACAIGYASAVDVYLTDALCDPPGLTESHYPEKLVRLPATFQCFEPHEDAPTVSPPPVDIHGGITFGSFHAYWKLSAAVIAAWSEVLARVPGSTILFKSRAMADAGVRRELVERFARHGVAAYRVRFDDFADTRAGHLGRYAAVDITLDTFPYSGATTDCESLWMGVPVVTLGVGGHLGRVGVSVLTNAGLPELVADDVDRYVDIAVELASDVPRLRALRSSLRARMSASRLMDAPAYTRDLEAAYRTLWRAWCAQTS